MVWCLSVSLKLEIIVVRYTSERVRVSVNESVESFGGKRGVEDTLSK